MRAFKMTCRTRFQLWANIIRGEQQKRPWVFVRSEARNETQELIQIPQNLHL